MNSAITNANNPREGMFNTVIKIIDSKQNTHFPEQPYTLLLKANRATLSPLA